MVNSKSSKRKKRGPKPGFRLEVYKMVLAVLVAHNEIGKALEDKNMAAITKANSALAKAVSYFV
jgi:hypothetical protein